MRTLRPATLSRTLALIPPAVALVTQHANAAFDSFIKFDSVTGESLDSKHKDWIDLSSFSFGVSNPAVVGGGGTKTGIATASTFTFHKPLDKSSPALFLACAQGALQKQVILEVQAAGANPGVYYRITLNGVAVNSVKTGATVGDAKPAEDVTLSFEQIKIEYAYQNPSTGIMTWVTPTGWDFANNKQLLF